MMRLLQLSVVLWAVAGLGLIVSYLTGVGDVTVIRPLGITLLGSAFSAAGAGIINVWHRWVEEQV